MSGSDLESRYRRLLAWYPRSHRREYEEEMLAVLMAGARPDQRRPTVADAANLAWSGVAARMRALLAGGGPAWVDAAAVFGLFAAVTLLSQRGVRLYQRLAADSSVPPSTSQYLLAAGWAAVVIAALVGVRRVTAVLAWVTALGQAVLVARHYGTDPVAAVSLFWPLVLGVVAAAALTVPAPRRRAVAVLGARRLLGFVLGIGVVQGILVVNEVLRVGPLEGAGKVYILYGLESSSELVLYLWLAGIVVGAVAAGLAVLTLPPAVRWRMAALVVPVAALAGTVELTLQGWVYANMQHLGGPIYLVPAQWVLLAAVPLAAFAAGAVLVRWHDRTPS